MAKNPYSEFDNLQDLLWEMELVADKYSEGNVMLIRTSKGWRAFLGAFDTQQFEEFEKKLDNNFSLPEKRFGVERQPTIYDEIKNNLLQYVFFYFDNYYPLKFVDKEEEETDDL